MKKILRKFHLSFIILPIISVISIGLTIFFFTSSLEIVLAQNISKSVGVIQNFQSPNLVNLIIDEFNIRVEESIIKLDHRPDKIQIHTKPGIKLDLIPSKIDNNEWLTWQGKAHYIIESEHPQSGIGNLLIYANNNWRTNLEPNVLKSNTLISIKTINYTNTYKIIDKYKINNDELPIITKMNVPFLLLLIHDTQSNENYLIKAIFISKVPKEI